MWRQPFANSSRAIVSMIGQFCRMKLRRILKILRLHFDTAGLPASATRYLEIERVTRGLRIFPMRLNTPAHAVPPCIASNWDTLGLQICLSCDANVAWGPMSRP